MTDAAKAVVWSAVYSPFGGAYTITGSETLSARFPGQWFQLEAGLHYNWHRHYDPSLGRYTQPDPLGFVDGPSVFAYAKSVPMSLTDFSGRITPSQIRLPPPPENCEASPPPPPLVEPTNYDGCMGPNGWADISGRCLGPDGPAFGGGGGGGNPPPTLKRLHPDSTLESGSSKYSLDYWRRRSTDDIVDSLRPGNKEPLIVKPDGTIMNGNTRVKVLEERGYDINSLPREPY